MMVQRMRRRFSSPMADTVNRLASFVLLMTNLAVSGITKLPVVESCSRAMSTRVSKNRVACVFVMFIFSAINCVSCDLVIPGFENYTEAAEEMTMSRRLFLCR